MIDEQLHDRGDVYMQGYLDGLRAAQLVRSAGAGALLLIVWLGSLWWLS